MQTYVPRKPGPLPGLLRHLPSEREGRHAALWVKWAGSPAAHTVPHPGLAPLAQISTCSASPERQQEDRDNQNMSGRCMSAGNQRTGKQGKDMWANGPSPGRMGRGCNQKGPIVSQPMAEQRARVCLLFEGASQEAQEQNKFPKCLRGARGWVRFSRISSFP